MDYDYDYSGYDLGSYESVDSTSYSSLGNEVGQVLAGVGLVTILISFAVTILMLVSAWKVFKKAGKEGYEALIAGHNAVVMLDIANVPMWYFFLFMIPFYNIYLMFKVGIRFAKAFGKDTGFGILLVFFPIICLPILAFGKAEYTGKDNDDSNKGNYQAPIQNEAPQNMNVENTYQNVAPVAPVQEAVVEPITQQQAYTAPVISEETLEKQVLQNNAMGPFPTLNHSEVAKPATESTITQGMPVQPETPQVQPVQVATDQTVVEHMQNPNINQNNDML